MKDNTENRPVTDLSRYDNSWYDPGAGVMKRTLWYFCNLLVIKNSFIVFSGFKVMVLKLFGAEIGEGVVIRANVNIKYPWNLKVGDHSWIGENVWIDNLGQVTIGSNVCLSQGAMLLTGNHNYKETTFDLITGEIVLEDGCWIGAQSVVCPGVKCKSHSILAVGSVAVYDLEPYKIYQGNPAEFKRERTIQ